MSEGGAGSKVPIPLSVGTKKRNVLLSRGTTYIEYSVSDHTKSNYFSIPFGQFPNYSVK